MRHFVFDTQEQARESWKNYDGRRGEVRFFWREGDGSREGRYYYGDGRGPVDGLTLAWEGDARRAMRERRVMARACHCGNLERCPFYKCNRKFNKILKKEFAYSAPENTFGLNAHHEYYAAIDGGECGGWLLLKSSNDRGELEAWTATIRGSVIFNRSEIIRADAPCVKAVWFFDINGKAHFVTDGDKILDALKTLNKLKFIECGVALFTYPQIAKITAGDFGLEAGAWISNAPKIVTFPQKDKK